MVLFEGITSSGKRKAVSLDDNGNFIQQQSDSGSSTEEILSEINESIQGSAVENANMPPGGIGWLGWLSAIWLFLTDSLPALINGRIPIDGSGVTQPISGTVTANIGNIGSAASESTLVQVRDAIKASIDLSSTIWTDNSGIFYVRRDIVNEGTGTITVSFTDPLGNAATPGAGLRSLVKDDKDILTAFYDVITSGTGYSVGDLLSRVGIFDVNGITPSLTVAWLNLTIGTILSSAPTSAHIEPANENIGARQVGSWTVAVSNLNADPTTATLQGIANTKLNSIDSKTSALGANTTANSQPFTIASDDAIAIAIRDRIGGTAITSTSMPTGGVGLFGWLSAIWQLFSDRTPTSLGAKTAANSFPVTLSTDGAFATNFGAIADSTATSDTGPFSLLALFKRLLSVALAKGQAVMASSISVAIASNQTAVPVSLPVAQPTAALSNTSASGTIAAGKNSVSFWNFGSTAGTLLGASFPAGASISYVAPTGQTLSAIVYDATGTTFLIGSL